MLKTVVRGHPGMVLLHDGVIVKKWSNYNLPGEEGRLELAALLGFLFGLFEFSRPLRDGMLQDGVGVGEVLVLLLDYGLVVAQLVVGHDEHPRHGGQVCGELLLNLLVLPVLVDDQECYRGEDRRDDDDDEGARLVEEDVLMDDECRDDVLDRLVVDVDGSQKERVLALREVCQGDGSRVVGAIPGVGVVEPPFGGVYLAGVVEGSLSLCSSAVPALRPLLTQ